MVSKKRQPNTDTPTVYSREEAERVFRELNRKRLNTEKYAPKNLRIFAIPGSNSYYLSYSNHASESEAIKVYKLLKLNDPDLAPRIIRQK